MLYPFRFDPIYLEKIWGGDKIKTRLGHDFSPLKNCGELWSLSGVEESESVVQNGFLKGNSLNEIVEVYLGDLTGDKVYDRYGNQFPILVKLLNAESYLSVQVHPGDQLAMKRHDSSGKSEMWYVIDAAPGAELLCGFNRDVSREEYLDALSRNQIKDLLNVVPVRAGDALYIPSGMVHAIGPGILLAEIQQTSDITYRIYDWGRIGADGMPRELHTELALDAITFAKTENPVVHPSPISGQAVQVVASPFFTVNIIEAENTMELDYNDLDSFVIYTCIEGGMKVVCGENEEMIGPGNSMLLPASLKEYSVIPVGKVRFLEIYIP